MSHENIPILIDIRKNRDAVFQQEADGNGIMMETNKPFPTVHVVQPLVVSQKKAVLQNQGIMMASKPDRKGATPVATYNFTPRK